MTAIEDIVAELAAEHNMTKAQIQDVLKSIKFQVYDTFARAEKENVRIPFFGMFEFSERRYEHRKELYNKKEYGR